MTLSPRKLALALMLPFAFAASARAQEPAQAPSPGDLFRSFDTVGVDGTPQHIDFPHGSTTVLLFFLSSCPTCHKMIPVWNDAYERRAKGVRIIGVILDHEPPGFFMAMPVSFPVVRSPGNEFMRVHNVNRVPLTLRIGGGGKIEDVGLGLLDPIRLGELLRP
jgi:thiol-disulfide isomerase/thioredoxin